MTLLDVSVGGAVAVQFLNPLLFNFDLMLNGAFGLGPFLAELNAQFSASVSLQAQLSISISNPLLNFTLALQAIAQLQASLSAALALGLPVVSVDIGAKLSVTAALQASLALKIGGLRALIEAALSIKIGASQFLGEFQANLSAGPIYVLGFGFDAPNTAADVGSQLQTMLNGGLSGISASDDISGIVILTKNPAASAAISALFKVA